MCDLKTSPAVGIGLDESNDRAFEKHCVFIVRYVTPTAEVKTTYLKMEVVNSGTSQAIFNTLQYVLREYGIAMTSVMSLGTDGASVMVGAQNGVSARLMMLNPFCIPVHCCCHKLNLSVTDVCKREQDVQVQSFI